MIRPELLAPAGDPEKLDMALAYGADAVYMAGASYGLRAGAGNFSVEALRSGIALTHAYGAQAYITINTVPRERELDGIGEFAALCADCGADAAIISDAGVLDIVKKRAPSLAVHISTQAGITNSASVRLWHSLGASRAILARELSIEEIADIRAASPRDMELEVFVHGAMCVSFSGRCLLSDYLVGREGNRGECAQPCRWRYALMQTENPGEYFDVEEHAEGSFILNSKDLCAIEYVGALAEAGVSSLKIEGRSKSAYYAAAVTRVYRKAIDDYVQGRPFDRELLGELDKVSHRPYAPGFLTPRSEAIQYFPESKYTRDWDVCAVVRSYADGCAEVVMKNPFRVGEQLELIRPGEETCTVRPGELWEQTPEGQWERTEAAMRNQRLYRVKLPESPRCSILRKALV